MLIMHKIHHVPPLSIYYQPPATGNWKTQKGIILRDKFEMALENSWFQLQVQPCLLCWGSAREKCTFQSIVQLLFQPLLCCPNPRHKHAVGPLKLLIRAVQVVLQWVLGESKELALGVYPKSDIHLAVISYANSGDVK